MKYRILSALTALLALPFCLGAAPRSFELYSPDGRLQVSVDATPQLRYSLSYDGTAVIAPSGLSVQLGDGSVYDASVRFERALTRSVDADIPAPVYKRASVRDQFNELTLRYKTFDVVIRAYDAGMAWRFVSRSRKEFTVSFTISRSASIITFRSLSPSSEKRIFSSWI